MKRKEVMELQKRIVQELEDLGKELGVEFGLGRATYTDNNATFKVTASDIVDGQALSPIVEDFNLFASQFGLKKSDLGRVFHRNGDAYKIIGLKRKAHKYPILIEDVSTGRKFKVSTDIVKSYLPE